MKYNWISYINILGDGDNFPSLPVIVTEADNEMDPDVPIESDQPNMPVADVIKSLVHFLASRPTHLPLWNLEDITAKGKIIIHPNLAHFLVLFIRKLARVL